MSENKFTKIATFSYSAEALILRGKLESENIEVFLFDNITVDTDPILSNAIGGVKMFVYSENAENAKLIVNDFFKDDVNHQNKNMSSNNLYENIKDLKSLTKYIKYSFTNFLRD